MAAYVTSIVISAKHWLWLPDGFGAAFMILIVLII
jgi:hypothetical protein